MGEERGLATGLGYAFPIGSRMVSAHGILPFEAPLNALLSIRCILSSTVGIEPALHRFDSPQSINDSRLSERKHFILNICYKTMVLVEG